MLKIFNSLTQRKEQFQPIHPAKVGFYACGITVYDYCHLGHGRALIIYDVIVRYLRSLGYEVNYVRNITDIDDKIINRANQNKESSEALAERFIVAMHEDERALGILAPNHEPRATQFIPEIINLIQQILASGYAYIGKNGDIYFDVRRFKQYGKLSHRDLDNLRAGIRIEISEAKRDPLDFVLWKLSKPGEPSWESPWGKGRPGWHIECSAMSSTLLGQPFDIHGGGMDLKFPHHENEIAQSEAAINKPFVKTWLHVGLLQINKEKMSKSLGNFLTIREILPQLHSEVIRYFMISGHYRSPINYSKENISQIQQGLSTLYMAIRGLDLTQVQFSSDYSDRFRQMMDDDFNTPEALAVLFSLAHEINRLRKQNDMEKATQLAAELKSLSTVFGILQENPEDFLKSGISIDANDIEKLIQQRNSARQQKDWGKADQIREQLKTMGIQIEDTAEGTSWRREN